MGLPFSQTAGNPKQRRWFFAKGGEVNCTSCGAPLPADSVICRYCGNTTCIDLKSLPTHSVMEEESSLSCPNCRLPLEKLTVQASVPCQIGHCKTCGGLFFGIGAVERLLDEVVENVHGIDNGLLTALQNDLYRREKVVYRHCPACQELMDRRNFGYRSGVVVDRCRLHGTWLDSGEFIHLAQWKKAGGQLPRDKQE